MVIPKPQRVKEQPVKLESAFSEPELSGIPDRRTLSLSPPPTQPVLSDASPYNPLRTPAFRHSPPRLPSDQPWRFSSVFGIRDVSLAELAGSSSPFQSTPARGGNISFGVSTAFGSSVMGALSPIPMPTMEFDTSADSSREMDVSALMTPPTTKSVRMPLFGASSWGHPSSPTTSPVARKREYEDSSSLARPFKFKRSHTSVDIFSSSGFHGSDDHDMIDSSPIAPPPLKRRRTIDVEGLLARRTDVFQDNKVDSIYHHTKNKT